ncbi:hypothetical protein ACFXKC_56090 [Streptomyces sp. NPDC059340]|uniref:hypothetical protein n=1 Tax=unclassified Streptomyces TaxID=2593676 RepID=UPI00367C1199
MSYQYTGQMAPAPLPPPAVTGQLINNVVPSGGASGTAAAVAQTALVMLGRSIITGWRAANGR